MLGIIGTKKNWNWAAFGKHPVAKDYFSVGWESPLIHGLSDWVRNGYQSFISEKRFSSEHISWRFWTKGSQREGIACGVLRDSSDQVGRPYPLLIIGLGPLEEWEDHWDLLPFACEKIWDRIEYLAAQRYSDFKIFESEISKIGSPLPDWKEFIDIREGMIAQNLEGFKKPSSLSSEKPEIFIPLEQEGLNDQLMWVALWHRWIKSEAKDPPNALFIGGNLEKTYLAVFRRAILPQDFVHLWSMRSTPPSTE